MADIELRLSAVDEASKTVEALTDKLVRLGEAYISVEGIKKLIETIDEAQTATLRLDTILRNVGNIGVSRRQMDEFSESLLKNSIYTREAGQNLQAMLATFQNINGDQFRRAQQAIVDFASFRGLDLESAGRMIGRVLNEPAQALGLLTRMGIQFSTAQRQVITDLIAVGEYAKAQDIILKKLTDTYGGTASAMANTLGGALTQLKNNFRVAFEGQGANVSGMVDAIHKLNDAVSSAGFQTAMQGLVTTLTSVAIALTNIVTELSKIPGIKALGNALTATPDEERLKFLRDHPQGYTGFGIGPLNPNPSAGGWAGTAYSSGAVAGQIAQITGKQGGVSDFLNSDEFKAMMSRGPSEGSGPIREGSRNDWLISFQKEYEKTLYELTAKLDSETSGIKLFEPLAKSADEEMKKIRDAVAHQRDETRDAMEKMAEDVQDPVERIIKHYADLQENLEGARAYWQEQANAAAAAGMSTEQFDEKIQALNRSLQAIGEEGPRAIKKVEESTKNWAIYQKDALAGLDHAFEGMFQHINEGFKGMVKYFLQALLQMIIAAEASDLAVALGLKTAPGTGGGTATGGIFSAAASVIGGWFGHAAAGGFTTGPTLVGERGPEIIVPGYMGASVLPNSVVSKMSGSGSGGDVHYAPVTTITGTGLSAEQLSVIIARNNSQQQQDILRLMQRNGLGRLNSG